jgi:hypothetical protein
VFEVRKYKLSEIENFSEIALLLKSSNTPKFFKDMNFVKAWDEVSTNENYLFVVTDFRSKIVGYLPLTIVKRIGFVRYFGPLGDGILGIAGGVISSEISPQVFFELILRLIKQDYKKGVNLVRFGPDQFETFVAQNDFFLTLRIKSEFDYPIIRQLDQIENRIFRDFNKSLKRFPETYKVVIDRKFNTTESWLDFQKDLLDFFSMHSLRWGKSRYRSRKSRNKLIELVKQPALQGKFFISSLSINGLNIAYIFGAVDSEYYYSIMPVYDLTFSKFRPGKTLLLHEILYAAENGLVYDFMNPLHPYKLEFSDEILVRSEMLFLSPKFLGKLVNFLLVSPGGGLVNIFVFSKYRYTYKFSKF